MHTIIRVGSDSAQNTACVHVQYLDMILLKSVYRWMSMKARPLNIFTSEYT